MIISFLFQWLGSMNRSGGFDLAHTIHQATGLDSAHQELQDVIAPLFRRGRLALCVAALLSLLAGCDKEPAKPEPPKVETYTRASWDELPASSDADVIAGFAAWRSACARLARDPVWSAPCTSAAQVQEDPAAVRAWLKAQLDVYSLRNARNS